MSVVKIDQSWGGQIDELQSKTIDFLRFPLAVLVIYIHSFGPPLTPCSDLGITVYDYVRIFLSHIIGRISVPSFYLISGYLFFYKVENFDVSIYKKKLKTRCRTILIPYLVWNTLYLVFLVLQIIYHCWQSGADVTNELMFFFNENGWINCLWACNVWPFRESWFGWSCPSSGPILVPMWFLRDLMIAFILAFPMYKLIRKLKLPFLFILLFCYVSGLWPNTPGLSIDCLMFFGLGAYLSINRMNMILVFSKYSKFVLPATIVLMVLMMVFKSDFTSVGLLIYPIFLLCGVVSVFICSAWFLCKSVKFRFPSIFVKSSFFVYASHTFLILWICTTVMTKIIPAGNVFLLTCRYIIIPPVTAFVCLLIFMLMERFTPHLLTLLSGNRNTPKI